MKKFIPLLLLFISLFYFKSFSQVNSFSKDPVEFQKEMKKFFKDYKLEEVQATLSKFLEYVDNGLYTPGEFLKINATCNLMLKKHHLKPTPHFKQYLDILVAYKEHNIEADKFDQFDEVYVKVLNNSKRDVKKFNESIYTLFTKKALFSSQSKTWFIWTNYYSINYDKKQPFITVKNPISLTCLTREDTLAIHGTLGTYYPLKEIWRGHKGQVNWRRVELDSTKVFAKINDYSINMKQSEFTADSVVFYNKLYFSSALVGRLKDKALTTYNGRKSLYPWFRSYKAVYILDKISKNVLYVGGFTQEGIKIMGSSSMDEFGPKQYARIYMSYKGQKTLKAESDVFQITPEKIVSRNSKVTIYFEGDSLYHPKIIFNYSVEDRKLTLTRGDEGMYRSPMFNSYHNMEMEFDQMEWKIDYPQMDFRMFRGSEGSALFTSKDYFTQNKYIRTQGVLTFHPLRRIKKYAESVADTNVFDVYGFAAWMGVSDPEFLESMLIRLTMEGFIIYEPDTKRIIVREKAFHFENASQNKNDYDFLRLESFFKRENAQFSLNTGNLLLEGVGKIMLSDTHRVFVFPRNQKLVMKKNRNFEFAGYIRAGLFEFFGNTFFFDYQNFKIDMQNIDSVRMFVRMDPSKPTMVAQIQSVLQNVSGNLLIDKPENKSGRINYSEYPIFNCTKNAYVYYDKKNILQGNYKRDRFYFNIKPFSVDSLDKFTMSGLEFDGTFVSGDILPVFDYKLVPQEDLSLGLTKKDIFPLYVGEGAAKGEGDLVINLSNRGLRGKGEIEYLTSKTVSDDFIFYLDSVRANSKSFDLAHNAMGIYPKVVGKDVFTRWIPYRDTMIIEKLETPFKIFERELEFSGDLVLTPERLTSSGIFNYKESTIKSKVFEFTPTHLLSASATLILKSDVLGSPAFVAADVKLDLDVNTEITTGECNSEKKRIKFPVNKYLTSMQNFVWYSQDKKVEIKKSDKQTDKQSFFMSMKKDQDSLLFVSKFATYDLNEYKIHAEEIPYIASADAWIYPNEGKAVIEKDAFMQSLVNSKIKADTIHFYHEIYDGFVNIFGKYKFTGYGMYDYIDKFKTKQAIKVHQIRVNDEKRMFARANIQDTLKFFLHPKFRFGGYMELNSNIKEPDFDGHIRPSHHDSNILTYWIQFHDRINPDSLYFSMNNPKGDDGRDLFTGMYVGTDSPYVYNVFFSKLKHRAHPEVFGINEGVLYYDDKKSKFVYSDVNKQFEGELRGDYFTYEDATGNIYAEGRFDFGDDIKAIDIKSAGNVNYTAETGHYDFEVMMMIDFPFDEKALGKMSDVLIENTYFKKDTRENRPATLKAIAELVDDEKERLNITDEIESFGLYKPTKNFSSSFILSDMKLTYNVNTRIFESEKPEIGLSSIKKNNIHKGLEGGIQITKRRSGTIFSILLQSDDQNYYYFKYNYGVFNVFSSDPEFDEIVENTASKNSAPKYRIKKGSNRDLLRFRKEMKLY